MQTHHEPNAGHSEPFSAASSDTIEMAPLEDQSLEHRHHKHEEDYQDDYHYPERESDDEDDGVDRALLFPEDRTRGRERSPLAETSTWSKALRITVETGPTLLITTVGLLFTGELLNSVSHWKAMSQVDELIMIIPVVLNLKGNLEMNLSARLGTAANMGELDKPSLRRRIILGNLSLLQVQATVVSFVAALVAFGLGRIMPQPSEMPSTPAGPPEATPPPSLLSVRNILQSRKPRPLPPVRKDPGGVTEFILTASSAMLATCLSSALLGSFMCTLVVICRKLGLDPDNIAPPIAACLGDLVTLSLLGITSAVNMHLAESPIPLIIIIVLALAAVGWAVVTRRNHSVSHLLLEGWLPLFAAMIISSGTGIVLDLFVSRYEGFALLATVISGLPGNVGSILVSRLSTALHALDYSAHALPSASTESFVQPPEIHPPSPRLVMITLLCVTVPIEIAFLATLRALGWLQVPIIFLIFSLLFFCIAVVASLWLARALTDVLWKRKLDPDMYALPIHSALVDLIGQLLLVVCFEIVSHLGVHLKASTP